MNELHPSRDYKSHGIVSKPDEPPEKGSSDDRREVIEMKFAWAFLIGICLAGTVLLAIPAASAAPAG
jgi:hypothetical protein